MNEKVAVIEIGSSAVVTLVGEHGVNGTMNIIGKGDVSYAGFQNAEFLEPENLKFVIASSISNAENLSDSKITEIYVGVPGEFSAVSTKSVTLNFPRQKRVTELDVENIFKTGNNFKNADYDLVNQSAVYFSVDDNVKYIDPVGQKANKLSGLIFSELKITILGFISSVYAEGIYLFDPDLRDKYVLFTDVGYITTSVALLRGNGLLFLGSFSMGGGYISSDLSQCLRIPFGEAERLKNKVVLAWQPTQTDTYIVEGGENFSTYAAKATNDIVTDRIEMICDYIQKCLDVCPFDIPDFIPMYFTGGGFGKIRGIRNTVSKKLKRQVIRATKKSLIEVRAFNSSEEGVLNLALNLENYQNFLVRG